MAGLQGHISYQHGPTLKVGGGMLSLSGTVAEGRTIYRFTGRPVLPTNELGITGTCFRRLIKPGKLYGKP